MGMRWVQNGPDDPSLYVAAGTDVGQIDPGLKQTDNTTQALPTFLGLRHKP